MRAGDERANFSLTCWSNKRLREEGVFVRRYDEKHCEFRQIGGCEGHSPALHFAD